MTVSTAPRTAVALSGGIDSLVAVLRLKAAGEAVFAIHFVTGYEATDGPDTALRRVRRLAVRLSLDLAVIDCRQAFQREVVDDFVASYRRGRTPNPCARCNPCIKFGVLLKRARALGATRLATGHYARLIRDADGRVHLYRGLDRLKEQSYFLARLSPEQLSQAVFPLGDMTKDAVAQMAAASGLVARQPRESQDVCFVRQGSYETFLTAPGRIDPVPGPIVDVHGRLLGRHPGLHRYTVGQRRGINCPGPQAYYVVRLEPEANRLVVGFKAHLMAGGCRVSEVNWLQPPPSRPMPVAVRLRYRSPACPALLEPGEASSATVLFAVPQMAVTPGQSAVFYQGEEVVGAGWIEAPI